MVDPLGPSGHSGPSGPRGKGGYYSGALWWDPRDPRDPRDPGGRGREGGREEGCGWFWDPPWPVASIYRCICLILATDHSSTLNPNSFVNDPIGLTPVNSSQYKISLPPSEYLLIPFVSVLSFPATIHFHCPFSFFNNPIGFSPDIFNHYISHRFESCHFRPL